MIGNPSAQQGRGEWKSSGWEGGKKRASSVDETKRGETTKIINSYGEKLDRSVRLSQTGRRESKSPREGK